MDISNSLKAVIILDSDGKNILSRSFDQQTSGKQFDRKLFVKTKSHKSKDDILIIDHLLVLHRYVNNLHLYVIGSRNENPLILDSVLTCLVEVISTLLSGNPNATIFDNMAPTILALDEICDQGIVMETDSNLVLQRVSKTKDVQLMENSMVQKLQMATEHIRFPWIRS